MLFFLMQEKKIKFLTLQSKAHLKMHFFGRKFSKTQFWWKFMFGYVWKNWKFWRYFQDSIVRSLQFLKNNNFLSHFSQFHQLEISFRFNSMFHFISFQILSTDNICKNKSQLCVEFSVKILYTAEKLRENKLNGFRCSLKMNN